ncbi:MAG TPA: hypothetical protein VE338_17380 [Ktedonobacterales bacterium]|jgi:hypothetical protein|nr:hypothetical protein [Ktedonobacterales bacterium]
MASDNDLSLDPITLAIEAQFLREWQAGKRPRLSVYATRYPEHVAALTALVASLPPDAATADETLPESFPERLWNGAGVHLALTAIFGEAMATRTRDERLSRVAEEPGAYDATGASATIPRATPESSDEA